MITHRGPRWFGWLFFLAAIPLATLACIEVHGQAALGPDGNPVPSDAAPERLDGEVNAGRPRWHVEPTFCVVESKQVSAAAFADATRRALKVWRVPAIVGGTCAGPPKAGDGVNSISLAEGLGRAAGRTHVISRGSRIVEADVFVSSGFPWSRNPKDQDFLSVLTHEAGHALGLDHVGDPSAVMAPVSRSPGPIVLRPADVAQIRSLYPEYWR